MPFERTELAFPCSSNESGSCPFQSLFLLSNNPLCCSVMIWLRSFSVGFNTEVRLVRLWKEFWEHGWSNFLFNLDNNRIWKDKSTIKDRIKSDNRGGDTVKRNRNRIEIHIAGCEWQESWTREELHEFIFLTIIVSIFLSKEVQVML